MPLTLKLSQVHENYNEEEWLTLSNVLFHEIEEICEPTTTTTKNTKKVTKKKGQRDKKNHSTFFSPLGVIMKACASG